MSEVLGPASLFYPGEFTTAARVDLIEEVNVSALAPLLRGATPEEVAESGIEHLSGSAFVIRAVDGTPADACGYLFWPNAVAHLCVLTSSQHRGAGYGQRVAAAAILRALDEGLLPQWRVRSDNAASRALAARLGLVELGAQLSARPV